MAPFRAPRNRIAEREAELVAEIDRLNLEIQGYQVNSGYEKGWEHGAAAGRAWKRERDDLQARVAWAVDALRVVGDDFTDWQVGYRAASERGIAALTTDPA